MAKKFEEIKEEEYPYELPEGWKWERLGKCVNLSANKTELFLDSTKYVGLENIEKDTGIIKYEIGAELKSIKNVFVEGQILYGKLRPYLNKHGIAKFKGVCSTDILVFSANNDVSNKWVDYYFNMPSFISYAISNSTGINLPRVNSKSILSYVIPIPPKETQQKIVDIIESLFAKLDIAQEKVEQVLAESENRRSAILHNAFSGKLKEKWREENNVSFDSWKECKFGDICKFIGGGTPIKDNDEYWNGNINWASIKDIKGKYLNSTTDFITEKGLNNSSANLCSIGELIIGTRINPGKPIISNIETAINQDLKIVKSKLNTEFLYYLFTVNNKKIESLSSGSTVLGIGLKILNNIEIDIPKEEEQKEIVRLLDKFLSVEDKVKSTCQNTLEAIATMRKSILAKAFRGELCS